MDTLMGSEDRNRKFEEALAKRLRSSAAEDSLAQNAVCPDAEILAAYHERSLSTEELNSWKTHIAACERCQEILRQLELTDRIPVDVETGEFVKESLVSAGGADVHASDKELMVAAAPEPVRTAASLSQLERAQVTTLRPRRTPWRWIAPAGAIAAGLLIWVALRPKSTLNPPQSTGVEMASNRETAASAAPVPQAESPARRAPAEEKKKVLAPRLPVSPKAALTPGVFSSPPPTPTAKKDTAAQPEPPLLSADATSGDRVTDQDAVAGMLKQSGAPKPPAPAATMRASGALGAVSASRAKQAAPVPQAASVPPQDAQAQVADENFASATETVEVTAGAPAQTRMVPSKDMFQDLHRIRAPNGQTVWMVGPSGFVQRSDDSGKTWKLQKSGVRTELRAGSAPSGEICWVVGSGGVILRTTDGGKNWIRLTSPIEGDLGTVQASSELSAVVTDASNKKSYATADGGLTWTLLSAD
jgi:Photosynthesis system II assembly factor YCF48